MSLNQDDNPNAVVTDEPWPLATSAILRVLAWPMYDNVDSIKRILTVAEPLFDNQSGCLCLRHDPEVDIPYEQAVARLQQAFEEMGLTGDLEVLFVTEAMSAAEWPRLAKSMTAMIQVENVLDDVRKSFVRTVGTAGTEIIGVDFSVV